MFLYKFIYFYIFYRKVYFYFYKKYFRIKKYFTKIFTFKNLIEKIKIDSIDKKTLFFDVFVILSKSLKILKKIYHLYNCLLCIFSKTI